MKKKNLLFIPLILLTALAVGVWWTKEIAERSPVASKSPVSAKSAFTKADPTLALPAPAKPAEATAFVPELSGAKTSIVRGPVLPLDQLMFGWDGPVELKDVPAGRLHDQLAKISPAARARALKQIGDSHIPLLDVASLNADVSGMLFYACDMIPAKSEAEAIMPATQAGSTASDPVATDPVVAEAPVPISSPPIRHSKPGATNVIYLDFNGHTITGTAWNSTVTTYVAKPFDKDGDPTTFSDAEQADIIHIWERVAEDYKPFNVDVTTEEPATFTATTGRILITPNVDANGVNMPSYTAGGVAYVGVFGASYYSTYSPALVYANQLANNEGYIAEACSHEMGHNMGLSHDGLQAPATPSGYYGGHGSGETSWGPLMGTGYNRNVSQWSKGEYYGANNTEDDLAIIAGKVGYQADDRTDLNATATPVTVAGATISASGFIGQTGEADRFSFTTGAGNISITASPFRSTADTYGGNLDIQLQLIDSTNAVLATANPTATTGLTLAATVGAGTYYLRVTGVGVGNPLSSTPDGYTSYASLGSYSLSGTIAVTGFSKFSAGRYHSLRLDASSKLFTVGLNTYGQLGNGTTSATPNGTPQLITLPGGRTVADIAAGAQHSLFLTTAGEMWVTGYNATGQLGDGTIVAKSTPFSAGSNVAGIAASVLHSVFLKNDGTLWTVGGNDEGQLGNGSSSGASVLSPVQIATNVVDLAAGNHQTLFVKADGTLWGTGDLYNNGTLVYTPIQITTGVKTVAAGGYHSLILKTDGTLWTLGFNANGQLGNGGTGTLTTPVQIATGVKAVAAGYFHSLFLKTDNTLWACGSNSGGQLGNGTSDANPHSVPAQLATNVAAVSASENYTLFTKNDGTLWATGYNANGQFGNGGTVSPVLTPVLISTGTVSASAAPSGVVAAANTALDRVNLTWQPSGTALGYEVWRSTTSNFGTATRLAQNVRWGFYQDVTASSYTTYYYWVTAVNPGGTSAPSTVASGSYGTPIAPGITTQPLPQSVNLGGTATFIAAASGYTAPTLQWQRLPFGSGIWANLTNAGSYSGVTTGTLTVSGVTTGMKGDQFRCVATNASGSATSNAGELSATGFVANDFNADGKSDVLLTNTVTGDRAIWLMNGTSISAGAVFGTLSTNWTFSGIGDFNGDGKSDIVLTNISTGERAIWLMNGTSIAAGASLGILPTAWAISGTGDFNGDGKSDILLTNTVTGDRAIWLMNGTSISASAVFGILSTNWVCSAVGDFNGDGKADILLTNTSTGERAIWQMNGTSIAAGASLGVFSTNWAISGVGDLNSDGKSDVLLTNTITGDRAIWLMNGTSIAAGALLGTLPTSWVFSEVGDFNGDGKADIFLTNTATGARAIWLMNGTSIAAGASLGVLPTNWQIKN